jgi:UDP-N-acetylglucosamine 2-epimerase (non-hydrolysing)
MELNKKKHFAIILGARPNFIKAAPLLKEAEKHPDFQFTLIHTGQHFDENMSRIFFEEMEIPKPSISLNISGEFHTEKIGKMFNSLRVVLEGGNFDGVIVIGDVNSTLAGGISAAKNNCRLIHVEAGLRSHDRRMPEEINRAVVDHLSDLLFTTEPSANQNLIKEGIPESRIKYVGNIIIEALETFWPKINSSNILNSLNLKKKDYVAATIHRQENVDNPHNLKNILLILQEINKDMPVIYPLHPGTKKRINEYKFNDLLKGLRIIEPLGYLEFMKLMAESRGVITDSGGIQEETSYLGIPCCTLRDNTERPITLELGSNKLFSVDLKNSDGIKEHLSRNDFKAKQIPLWDSRVSNRIFNYLKEMEI